MATDFPNYPATTFEQAVELAIFSSNQLHQIINSDGTSEVETENGNIPSVRKALTDNLYFKIPATPWREGDNSTIFNQLYLYSGNGTVTSGLYYAPTATLNSPITLGKTPEGDVNWRLYSYNTYTKEELSGSNGASLIGVSDGGTVQDFIHKVGDNYLISEIARDIGIKDSDVVILSNNTEISSYPVVYDKDTSLSFYRGTATGTASSWSVKDEVMTLITSSGKFTLYSASQVYRGDYSDKIITLTSDKQYITYLGEEYKLKSSVSSFSTTGTSSDTWETDKSNFINIEDKGVREELEDSGVLRGLIVGEGGNAVNPSLSSKITFGENLQSTVSVSSGGVLKSSTALNGVQNSNNITMPYVENTGNLIDTDYGTFAEKQLWLPSDNYEDKYLSPSLGITYTSDGMPAMSVITPAISGAGQLAWPNSASLSKTYKTLAFQGDVVNVPTYTGYYSDGTRYIQIAKWDLSSTPWNTEYKVMITSSNTDDRFIGSLIVEANIQASGTTLKTQSNLTSANINKYFKARFDGPSDRIAYASGTVHTIPMTACSTDGTYLYLWVVQQSGASSTKIHEIHKGVGTALTTDYTLSNVSKNTPSGRIFIPARPDYNGSNASAANDGHLLIADNHVRVCNTSGSSTVRPDIEQGGFVWGGYGTYKSNRESCTITRSGTGTYVVTGPHISGGWSITQPRDKTGEQVAIAQISSSSDGNTNTINVYAIKYAYNSSTGTVTRGVGDLMDIPASTWVDLHASTTF